MIFFNWIIGQLNQLTAISPDMKGVDVQCTPHIKAHAKTLHLREHLFFRCPL